MRYQCEITCTWFDTDHTTRCELEAAHEGWHCDGVRWFDKHGLQRPDDDPARRPRMWGHYGDASTFASVGP